MGTYDQIMEGRGIWRDRGGGGVKGDYLQVGDWIWKTPSAHYSSGVGDFI